MRSRLSLEQQRKRWYSHVSRTPSGHIPVLFGGIPAWQITPGPAAKVLEHFRAVAPVEHWPEWAKRLEAA